MKINRYTQALLIRYLLDGEYSCAELAELTGLHYVTVLDYTRELHRAGAAHICRWEDNGRGAHTIKVYKLGVGKDARRPRMTEAQRQARYREKKKFMAFNNLLAGNLSNAGSEQRL
jgi:hypothetical protein